MYCSRRRLLRRGLEFHVCTLNKSGHTKKSLETYLMSLVHIQLQVGSFVSVYSFLASVHGDTKRERHNSLKPMITILCWLHPNVWCILWCLRFISDGRDLKNSTARLNGRKLNCPFNERILNYCLFKVLKFSEPSLLGMMSSTFQPQFLSGVYYDRWWLSYHFPAGVKLHHLTMHMD